MKLSDWLHENRITQAAFASRIGSSQAQVARFAANRRVPNRDTMLRIIEATAGAVQPNDFFGQTEARERRPSNHRPNGRPEAA